MLFVIALSLELSSGTSCLFQLGASAERVNNGGKEGVDGRDRGTFCSGSGCASAGSCVSVDSPSTIGCCNCRFVVPMF